MIHENIPNDTETKVRKYNAMGEDELLRRIQNDEFLISKLTIGVRKLRGFIEEPESLPRKLDELEESLNNHTIDRDLKQIVYLHRLKENT